MLLDDNKEYDDLVGEMDGKTDELVVDGSAFVDEDELCNVDQVRGDGVCGRGGPIVEPFVEEEDEDEDEEEEEDEDEDDAVLPTDLTRSFLSHSSKSECP